MELKQSVSMTSLNI